MEEHMKAIVSKSGSEAKDAGAFFLKEQPIPEPKTQDLLVRVIAIGMNPVARVQQRISSGRPAHSCVSAKKTLR